MQQIGRLGNILLPGNDQEISQYTKLHMDPPNIRRFLIGLPAPRRKAAKFLRPDWAYCSSPICLNQFAKSADEVLAENWRPSFHFADWLASPAKAASLLPI